MTGAPATPPADGHAPAPPARSDAPSPHDTEPAAPQRTNPAPPRRPEPTHGTGAPAEHDRTPTVPAQGAPEGEDPLAVVKEVFPGQLLGFEPADRAADDAFDAGDEDATIDAHLADPEGEDVDLDDPDA